MNRPPRSTTAGASALADGVRAAAPICLGYLPVGLAFGVLAQKVGLSAWQIGLMSAVVFAGSSQFTALLLLGQGAALPSIVATTFVVNLRHLLMSSALAAPLHGIGARFSALFSHGVTDETFAVNLARFREEGWDGRRALVVNLVSQAAWVGSTMAGAFAGQFVPQGALGIDYALPAMFLCLLVFQVRTRVHAATAALSAALAVAVYVTVPGNGHVIAASVAASAAGLGLLRWRAARAGP
jgi:4-azaleucine resistance transporter AzlC